VPRPEWSALGPLDWASLVVVLAIGWAVIIGLGLRLTRLMPWYGRAIVWTYLAACAIGGAWSVVTSVRLSFLLSQQIPGLGQLVGFFVIGAVAWPYILGWGLILEKR
jgi:hypothetical protein